MTLPVYGGDSGNTDAGDLPDETRPSENAQPAQQSLDDTVRLFYGDGARALFAPVDFIPLTGEYDGDGPILWKPVRGFPQIYQVSAEGSAESCKGIWGKYYFLNNTDDGLYGPYDSFVSCVRGLKAYMTLH